MKDTVRNCVILSWIGLAMLGQAACAAEANLPSSSSRMAAEMVMVRRHVETLADDALEGREAGSRGGRAAATYIVRTLQGAGLQPASATGAWFQPFQGGCRNILATINGSDPDLRHEVVMLSAHYDHVGYGNAKNSNGRIGVIHNGADDNASGVAALLSVADALMRQKSRLRRSVLFVFWDGEEKGLWGSKYWLQHPSVPIDSVQMMINVDMVGRLRERLSLYGTRTAAGMRSAWADSNSQTGLTLDFPWEVLNNSDHHPFFQRHIPITMVHTGLHDDYHKSSDDAHLLNYDGVLSTSRLVAEFVAGHLQDERSFEFRTASTSERSADRRRYERSPRVPSRKLGITLGSRRDGQVQVEAVVVGSKAQKAGVKPGEVLESVNGVAASGISQVRDQIARSTGDLLMILSKNGESRAVTVPFGSKQPRIGISWRSNDAEPNVVTVSKVIEGSPADLAGLQRLDRIREVAGQPVVVASFKDMLLAVQGQADLQVERDGRVQTLTLRVDDSGEIAAGASDAAASDAAEATGGSPRATQ